jgi:hypothetical protein
MSFEYWEGWLRSQIDGAIKRFDGLVHVRVLKVESRIRIDYGDAAKVRTLSTKRRTVRNEYGTVKNTKITRTSSLSERTILRNTYQSSVLPSSRLGSGQNVRMFRRRQPKMRFPRRRRNFYRGRKRTG